MSKRTIETFGRANVMTKVRWDSDLREYTVQLLVDGKRDPRADYFTNDKADAMSTAIAMLARAVHIHRDPALANLYITAETFAAGNEDMRYAWRRAGHAMQGIALFHGYTSTVGAEACFLRDFFYTRATLCAD